MNQSSEDLLAFCRLFGLAERDSVCCGDVSVAQCAALQILLDGPQDVSSLAEKTSVTKGAITRLAEGLVGRGWVEKRVGKDDRRRALVCLTSSGRRKGIELRKLTQHTVDALLAEVPREKRKQVVESVHLLRRAAEAISTRSGCC